MEVEIEREKREHSDEIRFVLFVLQIGIKNNEL